MQINSCTTTCVTEKYLSGIAKPLQLSFDWDVKIKFLLEENNKLSSQFTDTCYSNATTVGNHAQGWIDKAEILTHDRLIEILKANLS